MIHRKGNFDLLPDPAGTTLQDDYAVGDPDRFFYVVGYEQDGLAPLFPEVQEQRLHLTA